MDEPQHHDVGRDAQEHVDELQSQVPDEHGRHVFAALVNRPIAAGVVEGSVRDEEQGGVGGVDVQNLHDGRTRRGTKI